MFEQVRFSHKNWQLPYNPSGVFLTKMRMFENTVRQLVRVFSNHKVTYEHNTPVRKVTV